MPTDAAGDPWLPSGRPLEALSHSARVRRLKDPDLNPIVGGAAAQALDDVLH